jgi:UDP-N-acetyl-D-glucosamine dehydrogenase
MKFQKDKIEIKEEGLVKTTFDDQQEINKIDRFLSRPRSVVSVQGLGFVGTAMVAALVIAKTEKRQPLYNVIGVDLSDESSYQKIALVNEGKPPVKAIDPLLVDAYCLGRDQGNLMATYSAEAFSRSDVVVVDIHLDIKKSRLGDVDNTEFDYEGFKKSLTTVAEHIRENTLVILETTVPPGTTERIVYPLFRESFVRRGLDIKKLCLCYSYERVTPGVDYLNSVINFYRVYAGINEESARKAQEFFESFINTKDFPLSCLHSVTACEMAKVLENSFRAMNIAFIQEWTEFADRSRVNLFEVIAAIRQRPTHRNIMSPGFGVGGYCLTKDPLLADWSGREFFGCGPLSMARQAVQINDLMPFYTFNRLKEVLEKVHGACIAVLGLSYLEGVGDSRYSPTQYFYDLCISEGAKVEVHDPLLTFWPEKGLPINNQIESLQSKKIEAVVFAVRHKEYLQYTAGQIMQFFPGAHIFVDANNILSEVVRTELENSGKKVIGIGKGHWHKKEV